MFKKNKDNLEEFSISQPLEKATQDQGIDSKVEGPLSELLGRGELGETEDYTLLDQDQKDEEYLKLKKLFGEDELDKIALEKERFASFFAIKSDNDFSMFKYDEDKDKEDLELGKSTKSILRTIRRIVLGRKQFEAEKKWEEAKADRERLIKREINYFLNREGKGNFTIVRNSEYESEYVAEGEMPLFLGNDQEAQRVKIKITLERESKRFVSEDEEYLLHNEVQSVFRVKNMVVTLDGQDYQLRDFGIDNKTTFLNLTSHKISHSGYVKRGVVDRDNHFVNIDALSCGLDFATLLHEMGHVDSNLESSDDSPCYFSAGDISGYGEKAETFSKLPLEDKFRLINKKSQDERRAWAKALIRARNMGSDSLTDVIGQISDYSLMTYDDMAYQLGNYGGVKHYSSNFSRKQVRNKKGTKSGLR